jgi:hypothetical protein
MQEIRARGRKRPRGRALASGQTVPPGLRADVGPAAGLPAAGVSQTPILTPPGLE